MSELLKFEETEITAYNEFRAQLAELETSNAKAVFDYASEKGNKEARSHVFKLRKTKTAVDKVRKEQKAASLEYGRRVDGEAKEIIGQIEAMIEVHDKPLKEIEQKEKDRVAAHESACQVLETFGYEAMQIGSDSEYIKAHIKDLEDLEPDEGFEEYTGAAIKFYKAAMSGLVERLAIAEKSEAEQAELEKLRAEKVEQERKDREALIAKEAAERAENQALENAERLEREKQEGIEREARLKQEAVDREERQKKEVEESEKRHLAEVEQARIDAELKSKRDAEELAEREKVEAEKRESNKRHKAKINNEAVKALLAGGVYKDIATQVVTLIARREIPNISISY